MLAEFQTSWESVAMVVVLGALLATVFGGVVRLIQILKKATGEGRDAQSILMMIEKTARNTESNATALGKLTTDVAVLAEQMKHLRAEVLEIKRKVDGK